MKNKRKYVLKNKKRFISLIFIILAVMLVMIFSDISYGYNEPKYEVLIIKSGDTLWDIAKQYNDSGDIRQFVYKLKKLNGLSSSALIEGHEIRVPLG